MTLLTSRRRWQFYLFLVHDGVTRRVTRERVVGVLDGLRARDAVGDKAAVDETLRGFHTELQPDLLFALYREQLLNVPGSEAQVALARAKAGRAAWPDSSLCRSCQLGTAPGGDGAVYFYSDEAGAGAEGQPCAVPASPWNRAKVQAYLQGAYWDAEAWRSSGLVSKKVDGGPDDGATAVAAAELFRDIDNRAAADSAERPDAPVTSSPAASLKHVSAHDIQRLEQQAIEALQSRFRQHYIFATTLAALVPLCCCGILVLLWLRAPKYPVRYLRNASGRLDISLSSEAVKKGVCSRVAGGFSRAKRSRSGDSNDGSLDDLKV